MIEKFPRPLRERNRQLARDIVLDAAERLLSNSATAEFSMRELAAEAGVGFATPFNHFGSKHAIMQALSSRLIARMAARFNEKTPTGDAIDRVLGMGRISVGLLLEQPEVSKAVVGSLGASNPVPSSVRSHSEGIWSLALGDCSGLSPGLRGLARSTLPQQLAFAFRGTLSFWIAGELRDAEFAAAFRSGAAALLLCFAKPQQRARLMRHVKPVAASPHPARVGAHAVGMTL